MTEDPVQKRWRQRVAEVCRQSAQFGDGVCLTASILGRGDAALVSGVLSIGLRLAAAFLD